MDADPETLTEPERRVALLDWLARGRDVRIAAELCGEKHDWAKDIAKAAGHPDRDQIRQALAAAKAELHPPRQPLKPDSIAPTRPLPRPAVPVEHDPGCDCCTCDLKRTSTDAGTTCRCTVVSPRTLHEPDVWEQAEDCPVHPWPGDVDHAEVAAEHLADVVEHAIETGEPLLEDPAQCEHQPRLVLEGRLWHAVCAACGTTWHRTRCTAPGCGAYVSAEYVARTGSTRHDWHPKEQS